MPPRRTMAGGAKKRPTRYAQAHAESLTLALRAHRKGDFGAAVQGYREALTRDDSLLDAWMNLGALCVLAGRAHEAKTAFQHARAIAPGDARVSRDVGIGLAAVGDLVGARAAFEQALAIDPAMLGARLGASRVCAQSGDCDAAESHARHAVRDAPGDASAQLERYRAVFDDRDLGPAIACAMRAVQLDPGYALARYFLAGAHAFRGDEHAAAIALGDDSVVAAGLRDAVAYVGRTAGAGGVRAFATARAGLRFALGCTASEGDGLVMEFGVRHGVSVRALAEFAADAMVHGFDSFEGLPAAWQGRAAGAFTTAGELPEVPANVQLHVGLFADTLPGFLADHPGPVRLAHVDSDLYESARTVLFALGPRVRAGSVLVFDEYLGNARWREDEFRALAEARAHFGWSYEYLALSWVTGQAVVRVRAVGER